MTDHLTPVGRSQNMAAIRGADTRPEMTVRRLVHGMGYRYRLHDKRLPGAPDLVFRSRKAVIFVHGCFWHQHASLGCKARPPKSNAHYWLPKLQRNAARDVRNMDAIQEMGWRALVSWECQLRVLPELQREVEKFLGSSAPAHCAVPRPSRHE